MRGSFQGLKQKPDSERRMTRSRCSSNQQVTKPTLTMNPAPENQYDTPGSFKQPVGEGIVNDSASKQAPMLRKGMSDSIKFYTTISIKEEDANDLNNRQYE